jgi:biotin carboxylase
MRLLVIDEPWGHTPWLMQACRDHGMQVEVAVRRAGIARCRTLGVPAHLLPDDPATQADALVQLCAGARFDQVLPVSERLLLLCAQTPALRPVTLLPVSEGHLPLLADRRDMHAFVASLGIAVPQQRPLPDALSIHAAAQALGWPLVIRGCQGTGSSQVCIAPSATDALTAWHRMAAQSAGEPFAQAFVPGQIVMLSGLARGGVIQRAISSVPAERWPGPTSPSTVLLTVSSAGLEALAAHLLAALHYDGLFSLECMQRADGGYTFIELNPRGWGSMACARRFGIDFAGDFAAAVAGKPVRPAANPFAYEPGVRLPLFPRYLAARISDHGFADALRNPRLWWYGLRPAPWRQPRLLLTLARQFVAAHRRRQASAPGLDP